MPCPPPLHIQTQVMLPIYCASRAATVALALAQVAVTRLNGQVASLLSRECQQASMRQLV